MTRLAREIATHIVAGRGPEEMLRRPSDPFWFQAFGCVLGFDWHSSDVTTHRDRRTQRSLRGIEHDLGVYSQGVRGPHHVKPLSKSVNGATGWLLIPGR
jgi:hypothetical protein